MPERELTPQQPNVFVPNFVPADRIDDTLRAMGVYKEGNHIVMAKQYALGVIDTIANLLGISHAERRQVPENMLSQFLDTLVHQSGLSNENILKYWLPKWTLNAARNYQFISKELPGADLENIALTNDGGTCVIPSTGPSLDANLEELRKIDRSKYKILAPTSALNPLIANGFTPDYACLNDGQPWVSRWHYRGLLEDLVDVPLITMTTCDPKTIKHWPGQRFYYNDYHPDYYFLKDGIRHIYPVTGVPCSGCVSNLAVRLAVILGFSRIVLLGNDLAFTGGKYCSTKYEREKLGKGETRAYGKWEPVDTRPVI